MIKKLLKRILYLVVDYISIERKIHMRIYKKLFFDPKDVERITSSLSGGERNRMLLAKILASPKEVLI